VYCSWAEANCSLWCVLVAEKEWRKDLARREYERWRKGHQVRRSQYERERPYWTERWVKSRRAGIARGDEGRVEGREWRPGPRDGMGKTGRRLSNKAW